MSDKNTFDDSGELTEYEEFERIRPQITYESWLRILLSRVLWKKEKLFWQESDKPRSWMNKPWDGAKKSKKKK